jgi:hypothetical protein
MALGSGLALGLEFDISASGLKQTWQASIALGR